MDDNLELNKNIFRDNLPRLLSEGNQGRFAVVHIDKSERPEDYITEITCWDTYRDASQYGHGKYRLSNFLIRKVERTPTVKEFSRPLERARHIFQV